MRGEQLCLFCANTGIDPYLSLPAEGPSEYSMGEPAVLEPCICQFIPVPCIGCGTPWHYDQPACTDPACETHDWSWDEWCAALQERKSAP